MLRIVRTSPQDCSFRRPPSFLFPSQRCTHNSDVELRKKCRQGVQSGIPTFGAPTDGSGGTEQFFFCMMAPIPLPLLLPIALDTSVGSAARFLFLLAETSRNTWFCSFLSLSFDLSKSLLHQDFCDIFRSSIFHILLVCKYGTPWLLEFPTIRALAIRRPHCGFRPIFLTTVGGVRTTPISLNNTERRWCFTSWIREGSNI